MEVSKAKRSFNMKLQKAQATRDLRRHPSSTAAISECEPHPPEGRPDHGDPEPATSDHKEPLPPSHADRCTRCQTSLAIGASPHLRQPRHYKTYVCNQRWSGNTQSPSPKSPQQSRGWPRNRADAHGERIPGKLASDRGCGLPPASGQRRQMPTASSIPSRS